MVITIPTRRCKIASLSTINGRSSQTSTPNDPVKKGQLINLFTRHSKKEDLTSRLRLLESWAREVELVFQEMQSVILEHREQTEEMITQANDHLWDQSTKQFKQLETQLNDLESSLQTLRNSISSAPPISQD